VQQNKNVHKELANTQHIPEANFHHAITIVEEYHFYSEVKIE
jgi:hypothetical protein